MRGNPLAVKRLSFQMLTIYCQSISFGLKMKSFVVQSKYNFEDKRKHILWYKLSNVTIRNAQKPNFVKCQYLEESIFLTYPRSLIAMIKEYITQNKNYSHLQIQSFNS